jgi:hypothetical protein
MPILSPGGALSANDIAVYVSDLGYNKGPSIVFGGVFLAHL